MDFTMTVAFFLLEKPNIVLRWTF